MSAPRMLAMQVMPTTGPIVSADRTGTRTRFLLLHNRWSGPRSRWRARLLADVAAGLRRAGASLEIAGVDSLADVQRRARAVRDGAGLDALIVAGGDGTIRAAASALVGSGLPIGVLPIGTANVLAREIGLPATADAIVAVLRGGTSIEVSCGVCDGEPFLLMASVGFDAALLARARPQLKRWLGKLAFAGPLLSEMMRAARPRTFLVDGVPYAGTWLIAANSRHYGGDFIIADSRRLTDPGLQALVIDARSRTDLLRVLLAIASNRLESCRHVVSVPARTIALPDDELPLQIDGDLMPGRRLAIGADKVGVHLIVPEAASGQAMTVRPVG